MSFLTLTRWSLLGSLTLAACSVINQFDEVHDVPAAAGTGAQPGGGSGGSGGSAGATDAGAAGSTTSGGSAGAAGAAGGGGIGGQALPDLPPGLIVISGNAPVPPKPTGPALSALSPVDGREVARESGAFSLVAYDGVRDIWFLARNNKGTIVAAVGDDIVLESRSFDRKTRAWKMLTKTPLKVPAPAGEAVTLRDRIAYPARFPAESGPPKLGLAVIDTTQPDTPKLTTFEMIELTAGVSTFHFMTGVFGNTIGGTLVVARTRNCTSVECELTLTQVIVRDTLVQAIVDSETVVGAVPVGGRATGTPNLADQLIVLAIPPVDVAATNGTVVQRSPAKPFGVSGAPKLFATHSNQYNRAAYDSCTSTAFVAELAGRDAFTPSVFAVPMAGAGVVGSDSFGSQQGQRLLFEPFTRSLISPFSTGANWGITAFGVTAGADGPKLAKRRAPDWNPPSDVDPVIAVVSQPYPAVCK